MSKKRTVVKDEERRASKTVRRRREEATIQERELELERFKYAKYFLTEEETEQLEKPRWDE